MERTTHENGTRDAPLIRPLSRQVLQSATVGSFVRGPMTSVGSATTLRAAVRAMRTHHLPAIAVIDDGTITGMLCEDHLLRAVADGVDPDAALVAPWMNAQVPTCRPGDRVIDAAVVMLETGIRDLPVVGDHGERLGFVHLDDIEASILHAELAPALRLPYMAAD